MEENNIMNNEEVMETTEEIVEAVSKGDFKKVTAFGLGMLAGVVAYKYVFKPAGTKIKTWYGNRKTKKDDVVDCEFVVEDDETDDNYEE